MIPHSRTILVVEDDPAIRRGLCDALQFAGYRVFEASTGTEGLDLAITVDCDLILLDVVLPGIDGMQILKQVRQARPTLPVIMLTARGEEDDRVRGLQTGADDYVVKPFGVKELLARVDAVLRRSPARPMDPATLQLPNGKIDLNRREFLGDDQSRDELTEREAEVLRYLARHPDRAISRDELLANVWRIDARGSQTRTVDMAIARLRDKLEPDPANPSIILTVRGKGYMLAAMDAES